MTGLQVRGRGFDSRPFYFHVTTLGKLFTYMCLCIIWQWPMLAMLCSWEGNRSSNRK